MGRGHQAGVQRLAFQILLYLGSRRDIGITPIHTTVFFLMVS
jgi:hypothetical protein